MWRSLAGDGQVDAELFRDVHEAWVHPHLKAIPARPETAETGSGSSGATRGQTLSSTPIFQCLLEHRQLLSLTVHVCNIPANFSSIKQQPIRGFYRIGISFGKLTVG